MPAPPEPHVHLSPAEVIRPHADMLADTPEQAAGSAYRSDATTAITALREAGLQCCRCDLCEGRTQVVFGEGSPSARLMIFGEAPGADEDKAGHPFWGRAGQVFNSLLEEAGLTREEIWLSNTVKCRPTKGEGRRLSNRPPLAAEIKACAIWRTGEMEIIKPRLICCLGSVAGKAILGRDVKMTVERGQWLPFAHPIPGMESTEVMLTYHPSFIMRQLDEAYDRIRAQAAADLAIIVSRLRALG